MNIYDISSQQMDDMATEYLNGMYESQYDDTNYDQADGNTHIKAVTQEEIEQMEKDLPF